ncbi:bifunctional glutamine-synthetase adenylyltransferase/deadenyltransferase [Rhizobium sp. Root274]|uniref:bifunctional [glutamine synthetase] adenylyltransferase/[glutamine synthetase]-adenylyl-L-tyrosine phosphorylase n=1 Tax=unclassified Rhizobium TaxID=2613769 RepID=UPI0007125704|nr:MULTISPECIES: bifunctional [glutamine synthetase] adenylyltransferase/[glutamine synthetase]-adenylyl-L-tyrosine phosphorylase [unclassified Rhizobium]KQW31114.1 bifunctional glutamine-synthetase adenylyltransferase/deadenyltransferase [Rhizobium sp. Root1240]KRD32662.1 bifunctional glutamine-synthetase adenylyltransferase/deadenyltransferase [Rhizobium sp. Root274]
MAETTAKHLADVPEGVIRPLNQTELKSATALLKDLIRLEPDLAGHLSADGPLRSFLLSAFTLSPYLREVASIRPALLVEALASPLEPFLEAAVLEARSACRPGPDGALPTEAEVMARLRRAKRKVAFVTALADLARIFSARDTTAWLTAIADAAVAAAIDHLLLAGHEAGKLSLKNPDQPAEGSGLIVLGMGKHGARELNYSSDIDLVIFYEPDADILKDPDDAMETYGRMMRRLVRILQERTAEGYVFRTDLRLRPDPGSTPLAVPVEAALIYYEGRGQNWERAAFIKARPVAGDMKAGESFLRELVPFVFRKYLDYAAIADIHSIKRQIHVHKGHGAIAVKGHNVKLGRGGIREIEFFAQTQQLIAGGRMPDLRCRPTEQALKALAEARWIDAGTADELTECYWFLRDVEHRIQMVHDEQTHVLPETEAELKRIAFMLGFIDTTAFSTALESVLKTVEKRYARLFEKEEGLSSVSGNLVFTGQKDDPDTLKTLKGLGFERPEDISRVIRTWHYGRYRATQSVEARERLTEMTPDLLRAFGESRRADEALLRFDNFLGGLPAGIQLFSLLGNNPALLELMVNIMAAAPRLAEIIAERPHVFDGMLDPGLLVELPTRDYLGKRLKSFLSSARHYEEILDRLRIFAAEQRFLIGIRLLTGAIGGAQAGRAFTDLADLVIEAALKAVIAEMETTHGRIPGGRVALVGMGKLGSFELTAGSDIDLILLYEHDDEAVESDGAKPLDPVRYFTRLTQRLIAALSAPTAEGVLYEVDMRLRPSGNKGPVATRLRSFARYQREEAWTWEHMALSRARMISGDRSLIEEAERIIEEVLAASRDQAKTVKDVVEMRGLIEQEKPARDIWDLKLIAGGLIDIEFIAQYLALVAPAKGHRVRTNELSTADALKALAALIDPNDLETCLTALKLYTDLSQVIRLCIDGPFDPAHVPAGLVDCVARAAESPDVKTAEAEVKRLSKAVRKTFSRILAAS